MLLTAGLGVDVRTFLFTDFFFSPSSITKEPASISLSVALTVGSVASAPIKVLFIIIHLIKKYLIYLDFIVNIDNYL